MAAMCSCVCIILMCMEGSLQRSIKGFGGGSVIPPCGLVVRTISR